MAEIDKLEIKIAANASDAASKIKDLASSLNQLGQSSIGGSASQLTELSTALSNLKNIKSLNGLNETISQISDAVSAINKIPVTENYKNIVEMFSGLSSITDNIKNLKVNKSFETNLDNLASAMHRLNEIGNTSSFADGVSGIEQAIERINNIEIGQGFTNLLQATSQFENAITSANDFRLSNNFVESAIRVARSAEILNDVDFSGMREMQDVLANMPEGVQVSFGSFSNAPDLTSLSQSLDDIRARLADAFPGGSETKETTSALNETAKSVEKVGEAAERSRVPFREFIESLKNPYVDSGGFLRGVNDIVHGFASVSAAAAKFSVKAVFSPLTAVGNKFSAAAKKAGEFLSSIKRIAMYRAIRSVVKAITDGFAEGRKNLYYYSQAVGTDFAPSMDKAATAALYLKNSIGAATAPLTNYLVPIIDRAVDHVVELINKFNELTAVLTGASTWTRALKYPTEWQDALDDANASAKKLKSNMLGFDELNVIEPNTPSSKSKALDAEDYSKMFEEMVTSASWRNNVPDVLLPVKLAWDAEGDNTLRTIKGTWYDILGLLDSVRESFRTVWMNGTGQKTLELILQITQNIVGTFGALAYAIDKAWESGNQGTIIIQNIWNVANNLLTVFRDIWGYIEAWAEKLDFSPILRSFGELWAAIDELTNPENGAMMLLKGLFDDVLLPLGKWTLEIGAPLAISTLASAIRVLSKICEKAQPILKELWDTWLEPIAEWAGTDMIEDLKNLKSILEDIEKILSGDITFKDWWNNFWGDMFTDEDSRSRKLIENINGMANPGNKLGNAAAEWVQGNWDTGAKSMGFDMGVFVIQGFFDGIASYANNKNVFWFVSEFVYGTFISAIKKLFKISSPSKVTKELGGYISDGLLNGIKEKFSITNIAHWIEENIYSPFVNGVKNAFGITSNGDAESSKPIGASIVGGIKSGISGALNTVTNLFNSNDYVQYGKNINEGISSGIATSYETTIQSTMSTRRGWIGDLFSPSSFEQSGKNINTGIETGIKSNYDSTVGSTITERQGWIKGLFSQKEFEGSGENIDSGISAGVVNNYDATLGKSVLDRFTLIKNLFAYNNFWDVGKGIMDGMANGINENASKLYNAFHDAIQESEIPEGIMADLVVNFKQMNGYAGGGIPETGELFIAREAGAELVGRFGNHTGVANNQQIVAAVSDGVYRAVSAAMAQHGTQAAANDVHIYLDRQEITSQVEQQQKANGVSIFSPVVYT